MTDERALSTMFHEVLDREDVSAPYKRLRLELEKPGARRRRGARRIFMTRNRLVLLAAALVLVLGISLVISARLFAGPSVGDIQAGPDKGEVTQLLARPLHLQHVQHMTTYVDCPDGPYHHNMYGAGPVYGNGTGPTATAWGLYWDAVLVVDKGTKGPIVFRGEDIVQGKPLVFVSSYGTGPTYGTDAINGTAVKQYTALAFDPAQGHPYGAPPTGTYVKFKQGFQSSWSGCVGFQADGPDFSETFYSAGTPIS